MFNSVQDSQSHNNSSPTRKSNPQQSGFDFDMFPSMRSSQNQKNSQSGEGVRLSMFQSYKSGSSQSQSKNPFD